TLSGLHQAAKGVTDAFVAAAWLVKDGAPQPANSFGTLFDYDANRHRAFWGINVAGQPVVGVSQSRVDSVTLGRLLAELGLQDAVMLDSGASTSLAFQGESMVGYEPRPVPHVVALIPPEKVSGLCPLKMEEALQEAAEAAAAP
ncbi:MAG: phosphodiester glycosidase family protein, partial [Cyanobacteria bacterium Co-bin13]|nr:phosphodiester glycosidase family protein [Cyanobacteria bacterium Co-bin13]